MGFVTFALMIGLIWLEIVVFGIVGSSIGVLLTIIGVFVTAAIGVRLFRISGRSTLSRMAESVQAGRPPIVDVADGMAIMVAAGLLLIPGYATDTLGLILFIPGLRGSLLRLLAALFLPFMPKFSKAASFNFNNAGFSQSGFNPNTNMDSDHNSVSSQSQGDASQTIIDGEFERKDER